MNYHDDHGDDNDQDDDDADDADQDYCDANLGHVARQQLRN